MEMVPCTCRFPEGEAVVLLDQVVQLAPNVLVEALEQEGVQLLASDAQLLESADIERKRSEEAAHQKGHSWGNLTRTWEVVIKLVRTRMPPWTYKSKAQDTRGRDYDFHFLHDCEKTLSKLCIRRTKPAGAAGAMNKHAVQQLSVCTIVLDVSSGQMPREQMTWEAHVNSKAKQYVTNAAYLAPSELSHELRFFCSRCPRDRPASCTPTPHLS